MKIFNSILGKLIVSVALVEFLIMLAYEYFTPLRIITEKHAILGPVIDTFTLVLVVTLVYFRILQRPLKELIDVLEAVKKKDFSKKANDKRNDELGIIAAQLNDTNEQLKNWGENLERKVQERTQEVSEALVSLEEQNKALGSTKKAMLNILEDLTNAKNNLEKENAERVRAEEELKTVNKKLAGNEQALRTMLAEARETHEELTRTQAKLVQADRLSAIGQLAAGVAHEINNPIGFINSNLSTLGKYISSFSEVFRATEQLKTALLNDNNLQNAVQCAQEIAALEKKLSMDFILSDVDSLLRESAGGISRIIKIISDLKTFARSDKSEIAPENLNEILDGVINIVWSEIKYKAELKKEYGFIPLINCNNQQLGQVFINMLINAVHAIEGKGIITVRTYLRDHWVCIDIEDTGKGIPKEIINKIYNPFFTTKEVGKGTGLGLSISYDIIEKHQGKIDVESEVGKGTKFTISLPIQEQMKERKK